MDLTLQLRTKHALSFSTRLWKGWRTEDLVLSSELSLHGKWKPVRGDPCGSWKPGPLLSTISHVCALSGAGLRLNNLYSVPTHCGLKRQCQEELVH